MPGRGNRGLGYGGAARGAHNRRFSNQVSDQGGSTGPRIRDAVGTHLRPHLWGTSGGTTRSHQPAVGTSNGLRYGSHTQPASKRAHGNPSRTRADGARGGGAVFPQLS